MGLHSTVSAHVPLQMINSTKWSLALDTIVCPFFGVGYHMLLQCCWLNLVSTWDGGMTRHFTLLWHRVGNLSTLAFVKLRAKTFPWQCRDFQRLWTHFLLPLLLFNVVAISQVRRIILIIVPKSWVHWECLIDIFIFLIHILHNFHFFFLN